ncbi:MAG TPA: hypothetical protein VF067_08975 [Sphingomicrobium sp.]
MPVGLPIALALLAQSASAAPTGYGPATPPQPPKKAASATTTSSCVPGQRTANPNEVVICAPKIEGYRLNPDVMEARREMHSGGRPTRPGPSGARPRDCAVGPFGCGPQAGINLVGAALTAAAIVKKAVGGENVGEMFVTDPHPSEYQLYLAAKARREALESERAAATQARAKEEEAQQLLRSETSGR